MRESSRGLRSFSEIDRDRRGIARGRRRRRGRRDGDARGAGAAQLVEASLGAEALIQLGPVAERTAEDGVQATREVFRNADRGEAVAARRRQERHREVGCQSSSMGGIPKAQNPPASKWLGWVAARQARKASRSASGEPRELEGGNAPSKPDSPIRPLPPSPLETRMSRSHRLPPPGPAVRNGTGCQVGARTRLLGRNL